MRQEQAQGSFGHAQEVATACAAAVSDGERLLASDPRRDRLAIHRAAYASSESTGAGFAGPSGSAAARRRCPRGSQPVRRQRGQRAVEPAGYQGREDGSDGFGEQVDDLGDVGDQGFFGHTVR